MEFVSLEYTLTFGLFENPSFITPRRRSNEVNAIIYAACIPTVIPIFTRSYDRFSSWAASKARDHKTNTSDQVIRLDSNDGTTAKPKRTMFLRSPLGDDRNESERQSGTTHILELDFVERSREA